MLRRSASSVDRGNGAARDRARLSHLGPEARVFEPCPIFGAQPRPGCPRADRRAGRQCASAASTRWVDGRRGGAGPSHRRRARAGRAGERPSTAAASGTRPIRVDLQHVGPLPGRHAHRAGGAIAMKRGRAFRPFSARGRGVVAAILLTFALFSAISVFVTISATGRSQHRAAVVEVAARQRTLAERYVKEVLLARTGARADPAYTAGVLTRSARALLDGGTAPAVNGDDDETKLSAASGRIVR